MSREPGNVIAAPIKISGLPEDYCFTSIQDFLQAVQNNFFAEIPSTITNVQVSNVQPTSAQNSDVWFRVDAGGKFLGIYMFDGATWRQVLEAPGQVTWIHGDSNNIPEGFTLVHSSTAGLLPDWTSGEIAHMTAMYYPAGTGPYTIFCVVYTGF